MSMQSPSWGSSRRLTFAVALAATLSGLTTGAVPSHAQDEKPADFRLTAGLTEQAVFSCRQLDMRGGSLIDSVDLTTGAQGDEGHVRSNADIELNGNSTIRGNAIAGPNGEIIFKGQPTEITGEQLVADEALDCEPIDLQALRTDLEADNDNGSIPKTDKNKEVFKGNSRDFDLKGKDGVTLPAGRYIFDSFSLGGQSEIRLAGRVDIFVVGDVTINGNGDFNLDGSPFDLRIWVLGNKVDITSGSRIFGHFYAPNADYKLAGQAEITGSIFADKVDISGGGNVRRVVDDEPPTLIIESPMDGDSVTLCEIPVSGRAGDNQTGVTLTLNGEEVELTEDPDSEDFLFEWPVSLYGDDPGLILAEVTDVAGNTYDLQVRVEIVAPVVQLTSPAPGSLVGSRIVDLTGTSGSAVSVTVNGLDATMGGNPGNTTFTIPDFDLGPDGLRNLEIVGTNCGGSAGETFTVDLDTLPPTIAIDSPNEGALFGEQPITVTGTVEDAHLTSVTVNGVDASIDAGRFIATGVSLAEGDNALVATATDALGRSTDSALVTVELDTTAPTVAIDDPISGVVINTPVITVTGSVSDPNLDTVTVNGVTATVVDSEFTATGITLSEGDNTLIATAVDQVGNTASSPNVTVVLDTTPPTVAIDPSTLDALTAAGTVDVTGTVADAHLDTVTVNGVTATVNLVDGSGTFLAQGVTLSEGDNTLIATATDILDQSTDSAPVLIVRDSTPPEIVITSPAADAELTSREITVEGTVKDAHLDRVTVLGVNATVTGDAASSAGATWTADVTLPENYSDITARAVDQLGQITEADPVPVVADTTDPVIALDAPSAALVGTPTVTVTGTVEDFHLDGVTVDWQPGNGSVAATVDGDASAGTTFSAPITLSEGLNTVTATADDRFGRSATSNSIVYDLDTLAPTISIDQPANGLLTDVPTQTVSGSVSDAHLAGVTVSLPSATDVAATLNGDQTGFSVEVTLAEGSNPISAQATDQLGLSTDATPIVVVLDTLAPTVTLDPASVSALTADGTVTVAGTIQDAHLATLTVNGAAATITGDPVAGATFTATVTLSEGANVLVATTVDSLGHASDSNAVDVVRDSTPPALAITEPVSGAGFDSRTIQVSGTVQDFHLDLVSVNGVPATVSGDAATGATFTVTVELPEGGGDLVATASDTLGQSTTTAPVTVVVDTLPPEVAVDAPAVALVDTPEITVTGTYTEPNLDAIVVNGQGPAVTATPSAGPTGTWTASGVQLVEGENVITATASDTFNHATTSAPQTWILDTLPPEVTLDPASVEALTAAGTTSISGTVRDAHLDTVTVNGVVAVVTGDPVAGATFVADGVTLNEGENSLVATAVDTLGHSADSEPVLVVRDSTPPTLSITEPVDGAGFDSRSVQVTGTVQDAHLDTVTVNGVAATLSGDATSGATFTATVELPEGGGEITATATDSLGQSTTTTPLSVVVDTLDPEVAIDAPSPSLVNTPSITVTGTFVEPHLQGITLTGDGGSASATAGDGTWSVDGFPLVEGTNTLTATASDTYGHSATSAPQVWVLDTQAPTLTLTQPIEGSVATDVTVVVAGTVQDAHLQSVDVNGIAAVVDGDAVAGANYSASVPLAAGANTLVVTATDQLGQQTQTQVTVLLDTLAPGLAIDTPDLAGGCLPAGVPQTLGGTFADPNPATGGAEGEAVVLEVTPTGGGAPVSYVGVLSADGARWQVDNVNLGSVDGVALVTAVGTDVIGNTSQVATTFRVDAAPPILTLVMDGNPFPAQGSGATPADGSVPTLVGGQVSFTATVEDGAAGEPPRATLTLNDQPYVAGTAITADGLYLLVARVTDCAGREVTAHAQVRIDRTAPRLISTNPADAARLSSGITSYTGTSDADLASATVDGEPAQVNVSGGTASFARAPYAWQEGDNVVDIELVDQAGNRASFRRTFTVTSTDLSVEILDQGLPIVDGHVFTRSVAPTAVATDGEAAVTLTRNGQAAQNGAEIAASGTYTMAARAVDGEGRVATASVTFTIDRDGGPQLTVTYPQDTSKVSVNPITVTGTVSGGDAPVLVEVNDLPATVSGGTWSVSVPLVPGDFNYLTAVATDARGRRAVVPVSIIHQEGAPTIFIFDPVDGTITNRDRVDVVGNVVLDPADLDDGTVVVSGPGGSTVATVDADGAFRAVDVPLVVGDNALIASVTDIHGNIGQASVSVFADGTPPQIAVSANGRVLEDGAVFGQPVQLTVEVTDDSGDTAETVLRLNGADQAVGGATTELTVSDDGGYLLTVVARDSAGNEARLERSFVLDRGGCGLSEIQPADGTAVTSATVTITGKSGQATGVTIRVAGQPYAAQLADGTFLAADVPLAIGVNTVEILCQDAGGASTAQSLQIERLSDGSRPVIQIQTPVDGLLTGSGTTDVSGTSTAPTVTVNGLGANFASGNFGFADLPLSEGPNIIGARAVDAAGRIGTDRVVVSLDSKAPVVSITSPDNQARVGKAGDAPATVDVTGLVDVSQEPNLDRVTVSTSVDGSVIGTVTASVDPATGKFVALAVPLDDTQGSEVGQTLTATAVDTLGNQSTATAEIFLDTTGPAIVLSEPADLTRFNESSPAQVPIRGEAWAADGGQVRLNGQTLDPATLTWSEVGADGRRHVTFESVLPITDTDGAFGLIAQVTQPDERFAETRRLFFRDTQAPTVVEMIPADGTEGVDTNALLLVLFSEPVVPSSLDGAAGLSLIRQSTGQTVVSTVAQAGNAVGLAPGAALVEGETYVLRAGTGIRDAAGNNLAATVDSTFTVSEEAAAQAPIVDPLPAVICAPEIEVTGTAAPFAQILVKDGTLTFRGFADADGAFTVILPVSANGFHVLRVTALDPTGSATSPETTVVVQVDCSAPLVSDSAFNRVSGVMTVTFSEAVDPSTVSLGQETDGVRLRDAEDPAAALQTAAVSFPEPTVLSLQLDTSSGAFWRNRPVRLQVGAPVADGEGNAMAQTYETVFFPGGDDLSGGFLFGEVYDDHTGRPLGSARVRLYDAGAGLPGAVDEGALQPARIDVTTEGRGRYTMAGSVPAARYAVVAEKNGYTRVVRRLALEPSTGAVPFDIRLTPLATSLGNLDAAAGGSLQGFTPSPVALTADAGALPGTGSLAVSVTDLSGQGLPDFLPLGWTPTAAAHLRLEAAGVPLADGNASAFADGGVRLDLLLDEWVDGSHELVAVQYQLGAGVWTVLDAPLMLGGDAVGMPADRRVARVSPIGPGTVAVITPDTEPAFAPPLPGGAGELLTGTSRPADLPAFEADLALDPAIITPTGKSRARVVARSADGGTAWPSGLAVQAFLEETLILAAGQGQLLEAPFAADLVLYQNGLSAAEQAGNALGSAGAGNFVISPSPRAAQVLLEVGYEDVRIYPFPETVERGPVVGPAGGTVGQNDGVELVIPEGALSSEISATAELLDLADVNAGVAQWAGYTTLAAVRLDFQGKVLGRPATLRLPVPDGTPATVAGDQRIVLVEIVEAPDDLRAAFPKLTARSRTQGTGSQARIVAGPDSNGDLPLEGLVREGLYLVLHADLSIGYATGTVGSANGVGLSRSRVTVAGLGTADLTDVGGRYAIPIPSGAAQTIQAVHPDTDELGQATTTVAPEQVVTVDIAPQPTPPTIVALTPADGAVDQPTLVTVAVQFNEALDPTSVGPTTLRIELADAQGNGSGVFAAGNARLSPDGASVFFDLDRPLAPGRRWVATFHGGVRDLRGADYAGQVPVQWGFATSTVVAPGGQVDPTRFHVEVPVNGTARIYADNDALPRAQLGQAPWTVVPYAVTRFGLDPVSNSIPATSTGSFEGTIGRVEYPVELATEVWVKILDPQSQIAAEFQVGPFVSADGKGFVAQPGEELTFRSAEGIFVNVPAGAFDEAKLVRVEMLPLSLVKVETPRGLRAGAYVNVDFEGEANETLRLSVPAPAGATAGKQVFVGKEVDLAWGRRLQMITYGETVERNGEILMSNDPELQPVPAAGDLSVTPAAADTKSGAAVLGLGADQIAKASKAAGTCLGELSQGHPCITRQLLIEFQLRSFAVWFYEEGANWAIIAAPAAPIIQAFGAGLEVVMNKIADQFVFIPSPKDSRGGVFMLPVIGDEPLVIQRRDAATGWVLSEQAYNPVGDVPIAALDPLAGGDPAPPMMLSAGPFEFVHFSAPPPDSTERLRLDIDAETDFNGKVSLKGVESFDVPALTSMQLFDLSPLEPKEPGIDPKEPVAGPTHRVCEDSDTWRTANTLGTDNMLLVISPGDLDPEDARVFPFQFDRPLRDMTELPVDAVATLQDLGPADGCNLSSPAGYPRDVPLLLFQEDQGRRVVLDTANTLPGGHRFRLTLNPGSFMTEGVDALLPYWSSAPKQFEFATREIPGETLGSLGDGFPFDGVGSARDMLRFGNLLVVGSDTGRIVAVDTRDMTGDDKFKIHGISASIHPGVRTFATDGHNRLFYNSLFGGLWAIKTYRLEDIRKADGPCPDTMPAWADQAKGCFLNQEGAVSLAYMPGSGGGLSASEFLALGGLPLGMPSDLEILSQDEIGKTLEMSAFLDAYTDKNVEVLQSDAEGFFTFNVPLTSTYQRGLEGKLEPSFLDDPRASPPAIPEYRSQTCAGEDDWDRYQRVTLDNLTTGQTWSTDIENPWTDGGGGSGTVTIENVRARIGDQMRVRYNLRALGYASIMGGGISVLDLNRGYRLIKPFNRVQQLHQCGRRLGHYAGNRINFPTCSEFGSGPEGILYTPAVAPLSETGDCSYEPNDPDDFPLLPPFLDPSNTNDPSRSAYGPKCRGKGRIDLFSPLLRVGIVHTTSGGGQKSLLGKAADAAGCAPAPVEGSGQ